LRSSTRRCVPLMANEAEFAATTTSAPLAFDSRRTSQAGVKYCERPITVGRARGVA
jgi:hypothetical protein